MLNAKSHTSHDVEHVGRVEPNANRVELTLRDPRARVAARPEVNKRVADGQPSVRHRVHVARIPCAPQVEGQLFDIAEVNVVVVCARTLVAQTLDLAHERLMDGGIVVDADDPVRIEFVYALDETLDELVVELGRTGERVRDDLEIATASQPAVHVARELGRLERAPWNAVHERLRAAGNVRTPHGVLVARIVQLEVDELAATSALRRVVQRHRLGVEVTRIDVVDEVRVQPIAHTVLHGKVVAIRHEHIRAGGEHEQLPPLDQHDGKQFQVVQTACAHHELE